MYLKRTQEIVGIYNKFKNLSGEIKDIISIANIINTEYEKVDKVDESCEGTIDLKVLVDDELFSVKRYKWIRTFKIDDNFARTITMAPYIVYNGVNRKWLNFSDYYQSLSTMENLIEEFERKSNVTFNKIDFINIKNNHLEAVKLIPDWDELNPKMFYLIDLSNTGIL